MEKAAKELLKEFVSSQKFTSTAEYYEQHEGAFQRRNSAGYGNFISFSIYAYYIN